MLSRAIEDLPNSAVNRRTAECYPGVLLRSGFLCILFVGGIFSPCTAEPPIRPQPLSKAEPSSQDAQNSKKLFYLNDLVIREIDGEILKADFVRPDDQEDHPLVVMIHGGAWSSGSRWNLRVHAKELAELGFATVSIDYRLAPAHRYPAQLQDSRFALRWAAKMCRQDKRWQADPKRIALWGYSAGAHLAALLVLNPQQGDPAVYAAALGGPPCEFSFVPKSLPVLAPVFGGSRAEVPEVYRKASPVEYASKKVCPLFIYHGLADTLVPPSSSLELFQKLEKLGAEVKRHEVPGKGHLMTFLDKQARAMAGEFLLEKLTER